MASDKKTAISEYLASIGRTGGANSRKNLAPAKRRQLAQKAAKARWGEKKRSTHE